MSNGNARFRTRIILRQVFLGIVYKPLRGSADIIKIHRVGSNAWQLGAGAA